MTPSRKVVSLRPSCIKSGVVTVYGCSIKNSKNITMTLTSNIEIRRVVYI